MHFELPELSTKDKIILISIAILVVMIPVGTYVLSLRAKSQSNASVTSNVPRTNTPTTGTSALDDLKNLSSRSGSGSGGLSDSEDEMFLGPSLKLKVSLEARPADQQQTKLFIGIANGKPGPTEVPQYIVSFSIDIAASGQTEGISLAGLTQGNTYTAYLKGQAQLATSSAFLLNPTVNDLGEIKMITGDVNDDNIINQDDYNLVRGSMGAMKTSPKWNELYDFNLDGVINFNDLRIISSHLGTTGTSGVYKSNITESSSGFGEITKKPIGEPLASLSATPATPSAATLPTYSFTQAPTYPELANPTPNIKPGGQEGYWIWLPKP